MFNELKGYLFDMIVMALSQEMQPPVFNIAIFRLQKFMIVLRHHVHEPAAVRQPHLVSNHTKLKST